MSRDKQKKSELIGKLNEELKESSKLSIMFHQAIADILKLNITDVKCMDFIIQKGSVTAGHLAEFTGLTTGAITALIDRLEKEGYVKREKDPNDRRRVVICPVKNDNHNGFNPFHSLFLSMNELCLTYTEKELELILDFVIRSNNVIQNETEKFQQWDLFKKRVQNDSI